MKSGRVSAAALVILALVALPFIVLLLGAPRPDAPPDTAPRDAAVSPPVLLRTASGLVEISSGAGVRIARPGDRIAVGESLATGEGSAAEIVAGGEAVVALAESGSCEYRSSPPGEDAIVLRLSRGRARVVFPARDTGVPFSRAVLVQTPNVSCRREGEAGAEFLLSVEE